MKLGHKITTYVSNPIRKLDYLVSETLLNMASPLFKYDPLLKVDPLFKCITSYFNYILSIYDTKCNRDDGAKPWNNEPLQMTSAAVGDKIEIRDKNEKSK